MSEQLLQRNQIGHTKAHIATASLLPYFHTGASGHHAVSMAPKMPVRAAADPQQQHSTDDDTVAAWKESYPLPDEAEGSRAELKRLYR